MVNSDAPISVSILLSFTDLFATEEPRLNVSETIRKVHDVFPQPRVNGINIHNDRKKHGRRFLTN